MNETQSAAPENDIVALRGVTHRFGSRQALDDLSLSIRRREIFGLLGPNGSGKSTVLSLLAGLQRIQVGQFAVGGRPLAQLDRNVRSRLGVVFQSPSLDQTLTARQNLQLAARLHRLSRVNTNRRVDELLELAGLHERAEDRVKTLSGGMKRRLDISRAVIHRPSLLLLDEPTSGLDEAAFRSTWQLFSTMHQSEDLTIVVATHRAEEADRCHRIAVLDGGRVVAIDSPENLRRRVAPDLIALETDHPQRLGPAIGEKFAVSWMTDRNAVLLECERGHQLIPRLVEAYPDGQLRSINLRRPTLADVFLKLTGNALEGSR